MGNILFASNWMSLLVTIINSELFLEVTINFYGTFLTNVRVKELGHTGEFSNYGGWNNAGSSLKLCYVDLPQGGHVEIPYLSYWFKSRVSKV